MSVITTSGMPIFVAFLKFRLFLTISHHRAIEKEQEWTEKEQEWRDWEQSNFLEETEEEGENEIAKFRGNNIKLDKNY